MIGFSISCYHVAKLQTKFGQLTQGTTCLFYKCVVPYGASMYATLLGNATSLEVFSLHRARWRHGRSTGMLCSGMSALPPATSI